MRFALALIACGLSAQTIPFPGPTVFINAGGGGGTAATPTASPDTGTYLGVKTVTLACTSPSPTIYYTLDGSTPTTGSTAYTGTISTAATGQTIKAICTSSGMTDSAVKTAIYTTGLVSAWKAIDGSGSTMADAANSDTITLSNASWSSTSISPLTNSVVFNGTTTSGVSANSTAFNFDKTDSFSVSMWVKPTKSTAEMTLLGRLSTASNYKGWEITLSTNSSPPYGFAFFLINTYPTNLIRVEGSTDFLSLNTLYHVVATYDGSQSASGVNLYVNGSAQAKNTTYNTLSAATTNAINAYIGERNDASNLYGGNIGATYIYNRVLSSGEVSTLYSTPYAPVP